MGKTVLVVDDSASLRQVVVIALKKAGYETIEACDGRDAITKIGGQRVNLIVSDVHMPVMDGLEMVTELKKNAAHKFTPVIMLTTESKPELMQRGKQAGVRAWMVKPFKPDQMLDAVQKLIA